MVEVVGKKRRGGEEVSLSSLLNKCSERDECIKDRDTFTKNKFTCKSLCVWPWFIIMHRSLLKNSCPFPLINIKALVLRKQNQKLSFVG